MRIATITEAKNTLSALIDRVRGGETILIVDRGRPVARLESAVSHVPDSDGRLARLERAGLVRLATSPPPLLASGKRPKMRRGASGVRALLDERAASR